MFGFGTLMSSGSCDINTGLCPEKGGLYTSFSADVIFHKRVGFNFETAWKTSQGSYGGPGGQPFHPILSDFNPMYQPQLNKKLGADLMAGLARHASRVVPPVC